MDTVENIQAMLQSVQQEREALKVRDETLKQREATLRAWLKEERPAQVQGDLPINGASGALAAFLMEVLVPGKRFVAGALGAAAHERGLIADGVSPGRAAHGALMGLQKMGRAERHRDGTWSRK